MKRYKCTVSYVGANYEGWQSQNDHGSIQEHLEEVISKIANEPIRIMGSGRTDAGVNARGQVFMFDTQRDMSCRKWMGAINAFLPKDIHILNVEEEDMNFHARYCVRYKKYSYRVNDGPYDVFTKDIADQCQMPLDIERMEQCTHVFEGTHDFTSFNSSPLSEYPDQVRTVYKINLIREGHMIRMDFYGKGFLRYMVRMMAAAIIDVGKHKKTITDVQQMLDKKDRTIPRHNAPAQGLTLEYVDYFDMVALNHLGQIREYIYSDPLPDSSWNLVQIGKDIQEENYPQYYYFCTRNTQESLGYFVVDSNISELVLFDLSSACIADSLDEQIRKFLIQKGLNPEYDVLCEKDREYRKIPIYRANSD